MTSNVTHDGFLTKQGGYWKSWKGRWFQLKGDELRYFKEKTDRVPKGIINVREISAVRAQESPKHPNTIEIVTPGRRYLAYSHTKAEMDKWIKAIEKAMNDFPPLTGGGTMPATGGVNPAAFNSINSTSHAGMYGSANLEAPAKDPAFASRSGGSGRKGPSNSSKRNAPYSSSRSSGSTGSKGSKRGSSKMKGVPKAAADPPKPADPPAAYTSTASAVSSKSGGSKRGGSSRKKGVGFASKPIPPPIEVSDDENSAMSKGSKRGSRRIGRHNPYKHILGRAWQKSEFYDGLKVDTGGGPDRNLLRCSPAFFAVPVVGGGGPMAVVPLSRTGRQPAGPYVTGNKSRVLDFGFSAFDEGLLACSCEGGEVNVFRIPAGGLMSDLAEPAVSLTGHDKKTPLLAWHSVASNVIISGSMDKTLRGWDADKGAEIFNCSGVHTDVLYDVTFSWDGSSMATLARDKQLRVLDPRSGKAGSSVLAHDSLKPMRCVWLGERQNIASVGFSRGSTREMKIWDARKLSTPVLTKDMDEAAGAPMLHYDNDLRLLYVGARGQSVVRNFEMFIDGKDEVFENTEYRDADPTFGLAFMPKRLVDVTKCEVQRVMKLTSKNVVKPMSFTIPRTRMDYYQDDLYPVTHTGEAPLSASEWGKGKSGKPKTMDLKPADMIAMSKAPRVKKAPRKYDDMGDTGEGFSQEKMYDKWADKVKEFKDTTGKALPQESNDAEWK